MVATLYVAKLDFLHAIFVCVKKAFTDCQNVHVGSPHVRVSELALVSVTSEADVMVTGTCDLWKVRQKRVIHVV